MLMIDTMLMNVLSSNGFTATSIIISALSRSCDRSRGSSVGLWGVEPSPEVTNGMAAQWNTVPHDIAIDGKMPHW
jgi:hypothetical protein